jgi:hypothetical protein
VAWLRLNFPYFRWFSPSALFYLFLNQNYYFLFLILIINFLKIFLIRHCFDLFLCLPFFLSFRYFFYFFLFFSFPLNQNPLNQFTNRHPLGFFQLVSHFPLHHTHRLHLPSYRLKILFIFIGPCPPLIIHLCLISGLLHFLLTDFKFSKILVYLCL